MTLQHLAERSSLSPIVVVRLRIYVHVADQLERMPKRVLFSPKVVGRAKVKLVAR